MRRLVVLLGVVLIAGCVCTSVDVENGTQEPIFVNEADHRGGFLEDYEGVLLAPGQSEQFFYIHGATIRVRTLDGQTISLHEVSDDADEDVEITDLNPLPSQVPVSPSTYYSLGPTRSSAILCRDGDEVKEPLFRTKVGVRSQSSEPLIVSIRGDWQNPTRDWRRGVLLPANGSAYVIGELVDFGWLLAYNTSGDLVHIQEVPREEVSSTAIPADLEGPLDEPADLYPGDCYDHDYFAIALLAGIGLVFLGAFIAAIVVVIRSLWRKTDRPQPGF